MINLEEQIREVLAQNHTAAYDLRNDILAVLSALPTDSHNKLTKEKLDELIDEVIPNPRDRTPPASVFSSEFTDWLARRRGAEELADAILAIQAVQ